MITCNGKVYRNLQEQVLKNQMDIEELTIKTDDIVNTDIGELRTEFEEHVEAAEEALQEHIEEANAKILANEEAIAALDEKVLKTPIHAPYTDALVGINSNNDQQLIYLGSNLSISNGILNTKSSGGGGGWTKGTVELNDLAETFYLNVSNAESPTIIGIQASGGYYSATMTNNAQASYPHAYSTLFYAWETICCIKSEDGTCSIIDAATGQTPPNDGGVTIEYWYQ